MPTTNEMFNASRLAHACYAEIQSNETMFVDLTSDPLIGSPEMEIEEAEQFVDDYEFKHQYTGEFGFSATVFRDYETGEYTLTVRGTEMSDPMDILTDILLFGGGTAGGQMLELVNYYLRLITPEGQGAPQLQRFMSGGMYLAPPNSNITGLGILTPANGATSLDIVGHSLGGHLALMLSGLIHSLGGGLNTGIAAPMLDDVITVNAAGTNAFGMATMGNAWVGAFGSSNQFSFPTMQISNIYDEDELEVLANECAFKLSEAFNHSFLR